MIFYIKLKKLKKLNKKDFSPSFTLLELVIVIILIGILAYSIPVLFPNNNLQLAADTLIRNIYFTQSLALKDDKYQPFPLEDNAVENNRSKYWFKQWWQVRFTQNTNDKHYWYEIFSDQPTDNKKVFDGYGYSPSYLRELSLAKNPLNGKYLIGNCSKTGYPKCSEVDTKLDLTKTYGIKKMEFTNFDRYTKRLIFDNLGNVFLKEGDNEDTGDINPLDTDKRELLTKEASIKLCLDNPCKETPSRCIEINITSTGFIYQTKCK